MDNDDLPRYARRWADAAWARGWYGHAVDVLDHAIRLDPNGYKLYRKRGAFYLLCPDPTVQDTVQGIADLMRACEVSNWQDDVVRWVAGLLAEKGYNAEAKELMWELTERGRKAANTGGA